MLNENLVDGGALSKPGLLSAPPLPPPPHHGEHARLAETVRGVADHGIEEAAGTSTTVVVVVVAGTGTVVVLPEPERQLVRVRSDVFRRCRSGGGGGGIWVGQLRVVEAQAQ